MEQEHNNQPQITLVDTNSESFKNALKIALRETIHEEVESIIHQRNLDSVVDNETAREFFGGISNKVLKSYRDLGLPFIPGKPYSYKMKDLVEFRDNRQKKRVKN